MVNVEPALLGVEWTSRHLQGLALALELCLEPAHCLSFFLSEADDVLLCTIFERSDSIGRCDVDKGTTEVNGAHDGSIFE